MEITVTFVIGIRIRRQVILVTGVSRYMEKQASWLQELVSGEGNCNLGYRSDQVHSEWTQPSWLKVLSSHMSSYGIHKIK